MELATPRSPKWSRPLRFPNRFCVHFSFLLCVLHVKAMRARVPSPRFVLCFSRFAAARLLVHSNFVSRFVSVWKKGLGPELEINALKQF
jgi:hypothetical protein